MPPGWGDPIKPQVAHPLNPILLARMQPSHPCTHPLTTREHIDERELVSLQIALLQSKQEAIEALKGVWEGGRACAEEDGEGSGAWTSWELVACSSG
jgi:hypothetical protein